jgi:hypothetical protein
MRQADDLTFAEALNALGIGEMKEEHIRLLKSRTFDSVDNLLKHNLITENATILTFTRKEMKENNERILNSFKTEGTVNTALDSIVGKLTFRNGKKLNMKKVLETSSKLDESKTYGLTFYLHLKKNARYMITNNIDTLDGLANGTTGKLINYTFSLNRSLQNVIIAWFDFIDPLIGVERRIQYKHLHIKCNMPANLTPIFPIDKIFGCCTTQVKRIQIPAFPAEAMTIHKAQG